MKEDTMKNKHEMREAAIKRLRETMNYLGYYRELIWAIIGDDFDELTSRECAGRIIDLLTDEPQYEDDAYAMGPRDANGIIWIRGDMSDSEWGVIERTNFDGEQWMVCGHDISAPWVPADSIRHAPMRTATQREGDMVALPVDADGEVIHLGDELQWDDGERFTVIGVGGSCVFYVNDDGIAQWTLAGNKRHYHKPTVEDMLRDFAYCLEDGATEQSMDELVGEYAKKLQLKEDE
jgi:hypothetical protein